MRRRVLCGCRCGRKLRVRCRWRGEYGLLPMLRMDQAALHRALEQLDEAAYEHADWHGNLLRAIVCGVPGDPNDLATSAHRLCRFGRWYYERAPDGLKDDAAFAAIGIEHKRLHRIAARMLRAALEGAPIVRADFEALVVGSARLREHLDTLRHEVRGALQGRDTLTGAYTRAEMLPQLRELGLQAKQGARQCGLALMGIDHLKQLNDTQGQQVGDRVLVVAARYLARNLRPGDRVFRYGGDEFLVALPGADLATAANVIERIRDGLARKLLVVEPGGTTRHVTASFGLALLDPEAGLVDSIDRADQALLLAKTAGRNRAIRWDPSVTTGKGLRRIEIEQE